MRERIIRMALWLLEEAIHRLADRDPEAKGGFTRLPEDIRWRLHVLACSLHDSTFWVRKDPEDERVYEATEVETGVTAWGRDEQEALENYWVTGWVTKDEALAGKTAKPDLTAMRLERNKWRDRSGDYGRALMDAHHSLSQGQQNEAEKIIEKVLRG